MGKLGRYLCREVIWASSFAVVALLGLFVFFDFIPELSSVGKNGYRLIDAIAYMGMLAPAHTYEILPVAVVIGGIFALTSMASNSELTVMRTAGVSLTRLLRWLMLVGALFAVVTLLLGEFVVPTTTRTAEMHKAQRGRGLLLRDFRSGVWAKDGLQFINIANMLPDETVLAIRVYEFEPGMRLRRIVEAPTGRYQKGLHAWRLDNVTETVFDNVSESVKVNQHPSLDWRTVISNDTLAVLMIKPRDMSIRALLQYVDHLEKNHQDAQQYQLAIWGKLFYPLSCVAMMLIALPFALGQRRSGGMGWRMFVGILVGVGFNFLNQITTHAGTTYHLSPLLVVALPTIMLFLIAFAAIWYKENR